MLRTVSITDKKRELQDIIAELDNKARKIVLKINYNKIKINTNTYEETIIMTEIKK